VPVHSLAVTYTDSLIPKIGKIIRVHEETPDVKSFQVVLDKADSDEGIIYHSGQCAMLSVVGVGEAMISITSTPSRPEYLEFAIKKAGSVTAALHTLRSGAHIGIRGPYGNWFPLEDFVGKDLLFVGGGIGLAPLRSVINNVLDNRKDYGQIDIVYGARTPDDLVFKDELLEKWPLEPRTNLHLTVDQGDTTWKGHVGFVPAFLESLKPTPANKVVITCGPPIMIKFVLETLKKLGFAADQVVTTLEMKMKCGIGKCGRCNIGGRYVCQDGPVFTMAQLLELPQEF
jgi:NAD(P)H-flavin reductase